MKKLYTILSVILLLPAVRSYGQKSIEPARKGQAEIPYMGERLLIKPRTIEQLKKTALIYRYQMDSLLIKLNTKCKTDECRKNFENATAFAKLISDPTPNLNLVFSAREKLDKQAYYNDKMLNILFANEVATYATTSSDLSLNKYYAGLDSEDGSLSFSMNFNPSGNDKLKPLKWLLSAGFKVKSEEKFATIFKNGKFENNDLSITGKATLIGRGTIWFSPLEFAVQPDPNGLMPVYGTGKTEPIYKRTEIIRNFRRELLERYEEKIKDYATGDYLKDRDSIQLLYNQTYNQTEDAEEKTAEFIESKYVDYYEKIAGEEINYMKKNKLYRFITSHWATFDFNVPIGEKKYSTALTKENPVTAPVNFYQMKANLTGTLFCKFSSGQSIYLTGRLSAFNNNNIIADEIKPTTFQTIFTQSPTQQAVVSEDKEVYVLESGYNNFVTGTSKFELVFFALDWIGVSPAVEKSFGQYYHPMNWKIGIPLSLKDKDGKASVNIEAQYKRVNNTELYGISASFFLGKFLN